MIILLLKSLIAWAAVSGQDDRIAYSDLDKYNPKILARATATQINLKYLRSDGTYPSGKLQNLCPGERFSNMRTLGSCSGFLIAPDILVTAGHCFDYEKNGCGNDAWLFNHFSSPNKSSYKLEERNIYKCAEVLDFRDDFTGDYAVLKLDRRVLNIKPLEMDLLDSVEKNDPVSVLGYPLGLPFTYTPNGRVLTVDKAHLSIDVDAFKNNSGSALINMRTGKVEGIVTNSKLGLVPDNLDGCQITKNEPQNKFLTLANRLKEIPYLRNLHTFKEKLQTIKIFNNCARDIRSVLKFRSYPENDWKTKVENLRIGEFSTDVHLKTKEIFINIKGEVRGRDFYGFIDNSREEELGFKKLLNPSVIIKACP